MGGWKHDLGQGSSHLGIKFPAILLLPRDAFTYKVFYRDGFTQRDDFTKECFYLQMLLHRDTFNTEMLLHTGALRYKYFNTEMILLREETFRHMRSHAGFRTGTFTPLHRDVSTQVFLHVNTSTIRSALRTHSFTLRFLCTQTLLHRGTLTHSGRHVYM